MTALEDPLRAERPGQCWWVTGLSVRPTAACQTVITSRWPHVEHPVEHPAGASYHFPTAN